MKCIIIDEAVTLKHYFTMVLEIYILCLFFMLRSVIIIYPNSLLFPLPCHPLFYPIAYFSSIATCAFNSLWLYHCVSCFRYDVSAHSSCNSCYKLISRVI